MSARGNYISQLFRDPNRPVPVNVTWPKYESSSQAFLEIDRDTDSGKHFFDARQRHFWMEVIPDLLQQQTLEPGQCVSSSVQNTATVIIVAFCMILCAF